MIWITIIQWTALAALAVTLFIISSPIRFGIAADYEKAEKKKRVIGGEFWVSYIHPALFLYVYSSRSHREQSRFFGFNIKKKRRKREDADDEDEFIAMPNATVISGADTDTDYAASNVRADDVTATPPDNADIKADTAANTNEHKYNGDGGKTKIDNTDDDAPLWARAAKRAKRMADETRLADTLKDFRDSGAGEVVRFLKNKTSRRKILKWLRRAIKYTLRSVRLSKLKVRARIGFKDPAKVGKAYGYFIATRSALTRQNDKIDLTMEPVFLEKHLEFDTEFAGKTSIAMILSEILAIVLMFPYWHVYKFRRTASKTGVSGEESMREDI